MAAGFDREAGCSDIVTIAVTTGRLAMSTTFPETVPAFIKVLKLPRTAMLVTVWIRISFLFLTNACDYSFSAFGLAVGFVVGFIRLGVADSTFWGLAVGGAI